MLFELGLCMEEVGVVDWNDDDDVDEEVDVVNDGDDFACSCV